MYVNIKLKKNFSTAWNCMIEKYGDEFAALNGFSDEILDYTDFIDNFIDKDTVADASIDANANANHKDIVTLMKEMSKPHQKLLAFNKIFYEINKRWGYPIARQWLELEWTKALYLHDSNSSTYIPYCFAYTLKRLAEEGQFFQNKNYNNCPPKHLDTFVDFVKEFVSYTSNRTSGACGLPDLIPYMYYFWRQDVQTHHMGLTEEYAEKYAKQNIQRFIYAVNQTYVRDNCQSAFTNTSVFDRPYLMALFGGSTFPDGSLMVDDIEGIMQFQKWYMEKMAEIRKENMFTFPVSTISLLKKNGKFEDEEFAIWAAKHNMQWLDSNIFCSDEVTSLSNCCRLKSNIKDLGFFNSVGGTSLRVGSVKVSTINLARIALQVDDEESYLEQLRKITFIDLVVLDTVRNIIRRNVEKGMLPNYCDGMIDMKSQYNTVGVLGIYEVMRTFGYTTKDEFGNTFYTEDAMRFGKAIFETIQDEIQKFRADKDYMINIEQVPGEQAAVKFMRADLMLYPGRAITDLPLYGNQFIPLGIKTTLHERIRISSAFDTYCNGGSITHINVEGTFTDFDQMWNILNYITDRGVTYFAFTTKIQSCESNHAFFGKICPVCSKPVSAQFARIVGFYTPIRNWSKERKAEGAMRLWMNPDEFCLPDDQVDTMFG